MRLSSTLLLLCLGLVTQQLSLISTQELNPPYFNLAEGRNITATATCGEDVSEPELFCKLVGSNWLDKTNNVNFIEGQPCDYCDPNDPIRSHPASNAIDGTESWWQSPPLSRGLKYTEVNLTIDLGQEFNVAYVFIKMGNSPRPGVWVLERSRDYGKTYTPWQYFADTSVDCIQYFGQLSLQPISKDDSIICETKFSKLLPLEGGEMIISLLNGRPNADNFSMSATLQEWSTATNIRIRLIRPKTTLGQLLSLNRDDPTVTRRYFYSIKDINIGGRCVCNGHASQCDQSSIMDPYKSSCNCQHNTDGSQCEQCRAGYHQYQWRRATISDPFVCEKCNCNGHSEDCYFDEEVAKKNLSVNIHGENVGGGVCQNCQHHTNGINCDLCENGYYRPYNKPIDAIDVCQPCNCDMKFSTGNCIEGSGVCECRKNYQSPDCDKCSYGYFGFPECHECHCYPNGTYGNVCELISEDCPCREGYGGKYCKQCSENYFGFPNCQPCECDMDNSIDNVCDVSTGQCKCKVNFGDRRCDKCSVGYFNYPRCEFCQCDRDGSTEEICNPDTGECFCKEGYTGKLCNECARGYVGYPNCVPCDCNAEGSFNEECDRHGQCNCKPSYGGTKCNDCSAGYYDFPQCVQCKCYKEGSRSSSCDHLGNCICYDRFQGQKCDKCKEGYYGFPNCEECNCNPAGLVAEFGGCDKMNDGELCQCKERVQGRICNQCKDLFWNLQMSNPMGCEECQCNLNGTLSRIGHCEAETGMCTCKLNVMGRTCDTCNRNTYSLGADNFFGCVDCNCDIGGSINSECDKVSGQCRCKSRVKGRSCSETIEASYFPTFYQFMFEAEDWFNPTGSQARFGYDEDIFPGYSWRGYASFNHLQNEILTNISISKGSIYKVIVRYVNFNNGPVNGVLRLTPGEWMSEEEQEVPIVFEPSTLPKLMYVVGKQLTSGMLDLGVGPWHVSLKADKVDLHIDYVVLIPQAYYDQNLFQDKHRGPCHFDSTNSTCIKHSYPQFSNTSNSLLAINAFYIDDGSEFKPQIIEDEQYTKALESTTEFVKLDRNKPNLEFDISNENNSTFLVVLNYHTPDNADKLVMANIELTNEDKSNSSYQVMLPACPYLFACRQILTSEEGQIIPLKVMSNQLYKMKISVDPSDPNEPHLNINQINLVPLDFEWSNDYITPKFVCINKNNNCITPDFRDISDGIKVEAELDRKGRAVEVSSYNHVMSNENGKPLLVMLDSQYPMIDIRGSVPEPGLYSFILHYYQPNSSQFEIKAEVQDSQVYSGIASIEHCPNIAGCRTVLKHSDTNSTFFFLQNNFIAKLKLLQSSKFFLDYVLIVPGNSFNTNLLTQTSKDTSNSLLADCLENNFFIDPDTAEDYCKSMIFSITVNFNGGALPCQCNIDGSNDHKCSSFGGQCNCKPNVIGRDCSKCKTGYYGFPNCKKCDCPSTAICHPQSGDCICPKGVTGKDCDKCLPQTFGFDKIIGCVDCACNPRGVQNHDLKCDLETGNCNCKRNIVGRTCNKCKAGFFSFPECQLCHCDIRGTTENICNQENARCFCKKNVDGYHCDKCRADSYYLEESNPLGCSKCFCFGNTDRCFSSLYVFIQVSTLNKDWELYNIKVDEHSIGKPDKLKRNEDYELDYIKGKFVIRKSLLREADPDMSPSTYISLPKEYLGKKVTSYGGKFEYTIVNKLNTIENYITLPAASPELLFIGRNSTLIHEHFEQPVRNEEFKVSIVMKEKEFKHLDGTLVSREEMMMTLVDLQAIYIRIEYFDPITEIELENILMDVAFPRSKVADAPTAKSVEQCNCPPNYKGTSCEECAEGYYRVQQGPYLGACIPCNCNGHSNECDPVTGKCFNCKYHTEGEQCEKCVEGYYGDAKQGTPNDCMICACPLPIETNNFATSCEVSSSGSVLNCNCKEGYNGTRCDYCSAGHYGKPQFPGYDCKKCQCNGNIDVNDPESCDSNNGFCKKCLNNSFGGQCEYCAPWYYGDAIVDKNCTECTCNKCGSEYCDRTLGECKCKTNVVGENCDKCSSGFYGFDTCNGCQPCNCNEGAHDQNCDDTGQCSCKTGVTGKHCDTCKPGFWNFSKYGCTSCECNEKFSKAKQCDQFNGQCQCLENVIGEKCERCPDRWVLLPGYGCQSCSNCIHVLLNDTNELEYSINSIDNTIQDTSSSVLAYKKLNFVNDKYENLNKGFNEVFEDTPELQMKKTKFANITTTLKDLVEDSEKADSKGDSLEKQAKETLVKVTDTFNDLVHFENHVKSVKKASVKVVDNLILLEQSFLNSDAAQNLQNKEFEMEQMLKDLKNPKLKSNPPIKTEVYDETLKKAEEFVKPSITLKQDKEVTDLRLTNMTVLISELKNLTQKARENTIKAEKIVRSKLKNSTLDKISEIKSGFEAAEETVKNAEDFFNNTIDNLEMVKNLKIDISQLKENVDLTITRLTSFINNISESLPGETKSVTEAKRHAQDMQRQSEELRNQFAYTKDKASDPLQAANAYIQISDAVEESEKTLNDLQTTLNLIPSKFNDMQLEQLSPNIDLEDLKKKYSTKNDSMGVIETQVQKGKLELSNLDENLDQINVNDFQKVTDYKMSQIRNKVNAVDDTFNDINKLTESIDSLALRSNDINQYVEFIQDVQESQDYIKQFQQNVSEDTMLNDMAGQMPNSKIDSKKNNFENIKNYMADKIAELKKNIQLVRQYTNNIRVGAEISYDSVLELNPPSNIEDSSIYTKFSMQFLSSTPNGLLAYIGNPLRNKQILKRDILPVDDLNRNKESTDYMSLEIKNKNVLLSWQFGNEDKTVESLLDTQNVHDGRWHQVTVERYGKFVKLSVTTGKNTTVNEKTTQSSPIIFNLDTDNSRIFIGAIPSNVETQTNVQKENFVGKVSNVQFNNEPLSLWNFKRLKNIRGADSRIAFMENSLRFKGNSYVILPRQDHNFKDNIFISFHFKTFVKDGLMFLVGDPKTRVFFSVEMNDGKVVIKYELGSAPTIISSQKDYNDGYWHFIKVNRESKECFATIDNDEQLNDEAIGMNSELSTDDNIYIGGYSGVVPYFEATKNGFDGCIKDLQIGSELKNLNKNMESYEVSYECSSDFIRIASFNELMNASKGYVLFNTEVFVHKNTMITFKFRTLNKNGLLLYFTNEETSLSLSIFLFNGMLNLANNSKVILQTKNYIYDDNKWHYISVELNKDMVRIDVDDAKSFMSNILSPIEFHKLSSIYIGGVSDVLEKILKVDHFVGCIGDININKQFFNFAEANEKYNVQFQNCPLSTTEDKFPINTVNRPTESSTRAPKITYLPPVDNCKLPLIPKEEPTNYDMEEARFGNTLWSRYEFSISNDVSKGLESESGFQVKFKTNETTGIIFYLSSNSNIDFVGLYFVNNKLHYSFDCGSGRGVVSFDDDFGDGKWHTATFSRKGTNGLLRVDDKTLEVSSPGESTSLNIKSPIYLGGISKDLSPQVKGHLKSSDSKNYRSANSSFTGCLKDLKVRDLEYKFKDGHNVDVTDCSRQVESGHFFHYGGGYIRAFEVFRVKKQFTLTIQVKPRKLDGVLAAVFGSKTSDFLALYMEKGQITFSVDNGKGSFKAVEDKVRDIICNGEWHLIKLIKIDNVVMLTVDNFPTKIGTGQGGISSTDTEDPLYIGGLPDKFKESRKKFLDGVTDDYLGCMRILEINSNSVPVSSTIIDGHVTLNNCPLN